MTGVRKRWYEGLPEVDTRAPTVEELERVSRWFGSDLRLDRLHTTFLKLGALAAVVLAVGVGWKQAHEVPGAPLAEIAIGALMMGAFGGPAIVAPIAEIVIGFSEGSRFGFALLIAASAVTAVLAVTVGGAAETVCYFVGGVTGALGLASMGGRMLDWYRLHRRLRDVRRALRDGEVVCFGDPEAAAWREPAEAPNTAEVLAPAGLVLSMDGAARVTPLRVALPWLGGPAPGAPLSPLTAFATDGRGTDATLLQRELSDMERRELRGLALRILLRGLLRIALVLWLSGIVLDLIDDRFRGPAVGIRPDTLTFALLIAGLYAHSSLRVPRWLLRDAQRGLVVVCKRTSTKSTDLRTEEALPFSGRLWSIGGVPHPWRARALEKGH